MTDEQTTLVNRLLDSILSDEGMAVLEAIRKEQDILGAREEGLGRGYYWFAIYGAPGDGTWAWRFGGHHVSLHATYRGGDVVSVTPIHLGGEMDGSADREWPGYRALEPREDRVRAFVESMNRDQWLPSHADAVAPRSLLMSEPLAAALTQSQDGLSLSDISGTQRAMVDALVDLYLRVLDAPIAAGIRAEYEKIRPRARFRWRGTKKPGDAHYHCVQGRGFLIESLNAGTHVHTIVRTDADFGGPMATPDH